MAPLVMSRAKWIWLVLLLGVSSYGLSLLPGGQADRAAAPTDVGPIDRQRQALGELAQAPPRPSIDTRPAASALAVYRRRHLNVPPQPAPARHLAVSGKRVGLVRPDTLVVHEPGLQKEPLEFALPGAERVVAVRGGLLGVGADRMLLVLSGERTPRSFARVTLFPASVVLPDLIQAGRLWVRHAGVSTLYGYELDPKATGLLPLVAQFQLHGARSDPFLLLSDGSFIYFAGQHWERFFPQGKRFQLPRPEQASEPFRMLRAQRIDQFFAVYESAAVQRLQLQDRLRLVWSRELGTLPVDIAAAGDTLVALRMTRGSDELPAWRIEVIRPDAEAPERIDLESSDPGSFQGDWVAQQLEPRALGASSRFIVLGGSERLRVWDLKNLRLLSDTR